MKKILALCAFALWLPLQACAVEQWQEGEHYDVINDTASAKPEILEFFSFWCPHCYSFETLVAQIKPKLEKNVKFKKVHVNFMGFTTPAIQDEATKAMMVARSLKDESLIQAVFKYIHVQKSSVTSLKDLKNIFIVNGVNADDFDKHASSFSTNNMVLKNNKLIDQYRSNVTSVPTFIVNGKYKAKFTREMTQDDIVNLIVWLTKQK
ncbi:thiol:disulfide interchange protein DsbA/DsbL [Alteromonadaceae bacterium BrNp21-10]|nr:thiol:disulfide interchange protein DsbA/DsbL [Alteromonadaceae bacterium BrNp21-10]